MKVDYYELLGVSRTCDGKALKAAYRKLAMKYHPDRNPGNKEAEQKFKEINEAYDVLKDDQKRAAYDRYGHAAFENGGAGSHPFGGGFHAGGFADIFEDIFGEMMGTRRQRSNGAQAGADLRYDMTLTLEEAYRGKKTEIRVPGTVACKGCSGTGAKPGSKPTPCKTCHGSGKVRMSQGFFSVERPCSSCEGRGEIISDPCPQCHGMGRLQQERSLAVNIPAGIEDGMRIRLAGEGEAGLRGGPAGDLYLFITIKPHEFFQREGANLFCRVPVSMTTAALGGSFEVLTLDGNKTRVKVPEGTQNGRKFHLKDKGMPVLRQARKGDLFIEVVVETPQNLSKKQRELLEEFEKTSGQETSPQSHGFLSRMKEFFENLSQS